MKTKKSVATAVEELLEQFGKPMHYKEITKLILYKCDLHGKTPHETVRSRIGINPKFIRVSEGVYALTKWKKYKPARFAKDIAYSVLKSIGQPILLYNLGKRVLEERFFIGGPKMVIRNAIRHDLRFMLDENSELVYLAEWKKPK